MLEHVLLSSASGRKLETRAAVSVEGIDPVSLQSVSEDASAIISIIL